ncbi:pilus assembly protein CpaB [Paenibacillus sophorae]|uniref:Pilus assembly protein CpaB n=1 Tax=Paenibacillus sophorae TaxID=1333845 RepID=A0A1H8UDI8_9BACL|nr:Flp pilus assembly protein CpaB [Paenibacillus sophorae]QWU13171.1 Flp pilus assembly protein CpaB [Paenibacillus sophorae]SEP01265.1 pilus assembly protein CpaB [Paenibacillus sophorae]
MKKLFRNRTVLGATCILLSLVLCLGIAPLLNRTASEQTEIVRIVKDVSKGALVTAEQVETVKVGAYQLPADILKSADAVIGQYAAVDLKKGDYLLPAKLSATPLDAYLNRLNGSKQAISVTIKSLAAGLSGKLQPSDIVTLIASDYGELRTTTMPPELQYVEVLAVTASSGQDAQSNSNAPADKEEDEKELPSTLTLLVLPEQAQLLADLENKGKLHAALVYRGDAVTAQQFIDKQDAYFTAKQAKTEEAAHD